VASDPVAEKMPVFGSYNSAWATKPLLPTPPTIKTLPSGRRAAEWKARGVDIEPVRVNSPVFGSYNSAEARTTLWISRPPTTRTRPFGRRVAVLEPRSTLIEPVAVKVPAAGEAVCGADPVGWGAAESAVELPLPLVGVRGFDDAG
jgi:hypothetical protein